MMGIIFCKLCFWVSILNILCLFREGTKSEDEKENELDNCSASRQDQCERKRKLSESSSNVASSNKKPNSNKLSNECLDKNIDNQTKGNKLPNASAKIRISVKPKKKKVTAGNQVQDLIDDHTKSTDDEGDIFDDIDVSKMDVDQEIPSSRSTSPNECPVEDSKNSKIVPSIEKSNELGNDNFVETSKTCQNISPKTFPTIEKSNSTSICSPAVLDERKHKMKVEIAKLVVKINESKDALDKAVERQEFLVAQELKTSLTTLEDDKLKLSSVLERGDAVELKSTLDERYKNMSGTKLFSAQKSNTTNEKNDISKAAGSTKDTNTNSKSPKVISKSPKSTLTKSVSNKQLLSKEERAKMKEEENKLKELEKKKKEELKEKERMERNAQKEKERKEKEEQREKERQLKEIEKQQKEAQKEQERKEKEQQKERERIEKLEQKQKERIEKERIKLAKEEEKVKKQLEKEMEKEEIKKEREMEKIKKEEEKERLKKEKEEKERLEKIEKEKEELKFIKPITSFFSKKTQDIISTITDKNSVSNSTRCQQTSLRPNSSDQQADGDVRTSHLSQFLIKKNMRIAPLIRSSIVLENKIKLDNIIKSSQWEGKENTYLQLLKSSNYIASSSGHTWPIKDMARSLETTDCDNEGGMQDNDEDDAEDQTVQSLLELDQSKIIELDIPDDDVTNERNILNSSARMNVSKTSSMFCKTRAKLLQFHENERPAYWGTWSKKSTVVGPRRPFAKDCHFLEYDYDSDDDWEEEEEGESLSDEEKDKEEDQDMKEEDDDDDGFFVGHGVLDKEEAHLIDSDEEDNAKDFAKYEKPSAEKNSTELEEDLEVQKMKMRAEEFEEAYKKQKNMPTKLKPRVFGCFWKMEFDDESMNSENISKDKIVHDQLMKILKPYSCVVMLPDSIDENANDPTAPIDTSHSINIRVS